MNKDNRIIISYFPCGLILLTFTVAIFFLQFLPTFANVQNAHLVPVYFDLMSLFCLFIALPFCKTYVLENGTIYHRFFGIHYRTTILSKDLCIIRLYSGEKYHASYSCLFSPKGDSTEAAVEKALTKCQRKIESAKIAPLDLCSTRSTFFLHWLIGDIFSIQYQDTETVSQIFDYCSSYCTVIYDILNQS